MLFIETPGNTNIAAVNTFDCHSTEAQEVFYGWNVYVCLNPFCQSISQNFGTDLVQTMAASYAVFEQAYQNGFIQQIKIHPVCQVWLGERAKKSETTYFRTRVSAITFSLCAFQIIVLRLKRTRNRHLKFNTIICLHFQCASIFQQWDKVLTDIFSKYFRIRFAGTQRCMWQSKTTCTLILYQSNCAVTSELL